MRYAEKVSHFAKGPRQVSLHVGIMEQRHIGPVGNGLGCRVVPEDMRKRQSTEKAFDTIRSGITAFARQRTPLDGMR